MALFNFWDSSRRLLSTVMKELCIIQKTEGQNLPNMFNLLFVKIMEEYKIFC